MNASIAEVPHPAADSPRWPDGNQIGGGAQSLPAADLLLLRVRASGASSLAARRPPKSLARPRFVRRLSGSSLSNYMQAAGRGRMPLGAQSSRARGQQLGQKREDLPKWRARQPAVLLHAWRCILEPWPPAGAFQHRWTLHAQPATCGPPLARREPQPDRHCVPRGC